MKEFFKWFKRRGWKSYTLPMIVAIVLNYGIFFSEGTVGMFQDPDIPPVIWGVAAIAYLGFHIGMTWHLITSYKLQSNEENY